MRQPNGDPVQPLSSRLAFGLPGEATRFVPPLAAGGISIVAGGLVAAVTQPSGWEHGSWAAAFLVLVMGVAQIGLVTGQALLARVLPGSGYFAVECALWNVGGLFVIVGTVWSTPVVVSVGSAFLVVVVGMVIGAVGGAGADSRPLPVLFRCLLVVLVVSIPIGTVLAWVRS